MLAGFRLKLTFTRLLTMAFTHERSHVNLQGVKKAAHHHSDLDIMEQHEYQERTPVQWSCRHAARHGGAHGCQDQPRPRLWQLPQEAPRSTGNQNRLSALVPLLDLSRTHLQVSLCSPDTFYILSIQPSDFQKNPSFPFPTAPTRAAHSPNLELRTAPGATGHGELQRSEGANSRLYPGRGSCNCQHKSFG